MFEDFYLGGGGGDKEEGSHLKIRKNGNDKLILCRNMNSEKKKGFTNSVLSVRGLVTMKISTYRVTMVIWTQISFLRISRVFGPGFLTLVILWRVINGGLQKTTTFCQLLRFIPKDNKQGNAVSQRNHLFRPCNVVFGWPVWVLVRSLPLAGGFSSCGGRGKFVKAPSIGLYLFVW